MNTVHATLPALRALPPAIALLPLGSFEQHGSHLPYTTDTLVAQTLAQELAQHLPALLLPALPFSCSHEHAGFPYAVSLGSRTLYAVIEDCLLSLERSGVKLLIILNGHGGNYVLGNIAQELNQDRPRVLVLPQRQHWQTGLDATELDVTISSDMHGGALETSLLMHVAPHLVHSEQAQDHEATLRPWLQQLGMSHYTSSGIIGFPTQASAQAGAQLLQAMVQHLLGDIQEFCTLIGLEL